MNAGAEITSFAVLHDWYAALAAFRTEAQDALTMLALSLQRAADWLGEQQQYWQRQIRICEEEVTQAKTELRNRQCPDFHGNRPDSTVQEKNLRKAQARLEFAEERMAAVRRWMVQLPKEICAAYDGPAGRLAFFLEGELPSGLAQLDRQMTALEQYANLQAPVAVAVEPAKEKS